MDTNIYIACLRQVVAFAPKVIKCAAYGVAQGRGWRYGRIGGRKDRYKGGVLASDNSCFYYITLALRANIE